MAEDQFKSSRSQEQVQTRNSSSSMGPNKSARDLENGSVVAVDPRNPGNSKNLQKNFNLVSLASIGLVVGNVWPALGGSLLTSIANGGAPGVIYEFIAVSICYFTIAAVLAELASALPSSAGVHLWASITSGPRYGRAVGYFAGWWNCLAWVFAEASMSFIAGMLLYHDLHQSKSLMLFTSRQSVCPDVCPHAPRLYCRKLVS